jgi:hypothetical protein
VRLYDGLIESDGEPEPEQAHPKGGAA